MRKIFVVLVFVLSAVVGYAQEVLSLEDLGGKKEQRVMAVDSIYLHADTSVVSVPVDSSVIVPVAADVASVEVVSEKENARKKKEAVYRDYAVTNSRFALSTNCFDWLYFLTPNVSVQYALNQHWTLLAEAKYNNWSYNSDSIDNRIRQARQEYSFGFRWWGWYTYSGWWVGCRAMYREYSGNWALAHSFSDWGNRSIKEEGDAFGLAVSGGYSLQLKRWLDLDFGIGLLGGYTFYKQYSGEADGTGAVCPRYGRRIDAAVDEPASQAFFIGPAEVVVSLVFIF